MRKWNAVAALAAFTAAVCAQETKTDGESAPRQLADVVVSATRTDTPSAKLGQSYTIITQQDLSEAKTPDVLTALRELPGLDVKSFGPYDSNAQLSIRAMDSYHTKVLLDGVPVMDNSSTQAMPVLGNLALWDIDRIEILRGATSLQGSSAMGGVVNIITKRPTEDGIHGAMGLEAGSHSRLNSNAALYGKEGPVDFRLSLGRTRQRGVSVVARDPYGSVNDDNDHYRDIHTAGYAGWQIDENWRLELTGQFQDIDEEYDSGYSYDDWSNPGSTIVVPDQDDTWVRRAMGSAKLEGKDLFDGRLDTRLVYALNRTDRSYLNQGSTEYRYVGDTEFISWLNTCHLDDRNDISAGLEFQDERARNEAFHKTTLDKHHRTTAGTLSYATEPLDNLFLALNGRFNDHSEFDTEWTGDTNAKYILVATGTTVKGSFGKGYRSPTVYELYAPANGWGFTGGNKDLKPETNISWELGVEQELLDKTVTAGTSYFENSVDNYIYATTQSYEQRDGVSIRGIESFITYKPMKSLKLNLSHIYQRARDTETGNKHIAYIPRQKVACNASWHPLPDERLTINLGGAWTGSRYNEKNADYVSRTKLDDYFLVHTAVSYKLTKNLEIYGRIDNLLNENYILSDDYGTRYSTLGRTYTLGMVCSF